MIWLSKLFFFGLVYGTFTAAQEFFGGIYHRTLVVADWAERHLDDLLLDETK